MAWNCCITSIGELIGIGRIDLVSGDMRDLDGVVVGQEWNPWAAAGSGATSSVARSRSTG
jgi:hypothetical protein